MWTILEFIFAFLIANSLGVFSRYLYFKLIGRTKSIGYLLGNSDDGANNVSHGVLNFVVGIMMLGLIVFVVYLFDTYIFHFI